MTFVYIQVLRFIAAAAVVCFHAYDASEAFLAAKGANYLQLLNFGRYGVDIFFVISGFIIYY